MKLVETVISSALEGMFLCGCDTVYLHVSRGFGGKARSDVSMSHIFPQGVLAAITLVEYGAWDGGARVRARCELRLLLYSAVNTTLMGTGQVLSCWSRSPEAQVWDSSVTSECVLPPSTRTLTPEGSNVGPKGTRVGTQHGLQCRLWQSWPQSGFWTAANVLPLHMPAVAALVLLKCCSGSDNHAVFSAAAAPIPLWSCAREQEKL